MTHDPRALLRRMFDAAVTAADPARAIAAHLSAPPKGRTIVIGGGKASAAMAQALEAHWSGPLEGAVVTRYGYGATCERIRVLEAAHPVPDAAGEAGARELMRLVQGLKEDDLVIALISGGGSALLPLPPPGLTLADEQALNQALLASGMPIQDMNCVRKHLSLIKGGRLAAACAPARVVSLVLSDIPGDDPALVASGPTIPDNRGRADALAALARYRVSLPAAAQNWIESEAADAPRADDPRFTRNEVKLIGSAALSLAAAAEVARSEGLAVHILSDAIEGESREVARVHAAIAREVAARGRPFSAPCVILSGGETTVTLRGKGGRGGRNSEFLLALALDIRGQEKITALAADTDGIDGSEDNAGAFADGTTVARLASQGLNAQDILMQNDAWGAFNALGDLLVTGPTRTNVNDFRAILIQ